MGKGILWLSDMVGIYYTLWPASIICRPLILPDRWISGPEGYASFYLKSVRPVVPKNIIEKKEWMSPNFMNPCSVRITYYLFGPSFSFSLRPFYPLLFKVKHITIPPFSILSDTVGFDFNCSIYKLKASSFLSSFFLNHYAPVSTRTMHVQRLCR